MCNITLRVVQSRCIAAEMTLFGHPHLGTFVFQLFFVTPHSTLWLRARAIFGVGSFGASLGEANFRLRQGQHSVEAGPRSRLSQARKQTALSVGVARRAGIVRKSYTLARPI
jgi:hypothetical protein